ncbi:MAG: hypothetical protein ACR2FY_24535 [Pirellulaceae bacterium]
MVNSQPIRKKDSRWLFYAAAFGLAILAVFTFEVSLLAYGLWDAPIVFRIIAISVPLVLLLGFTLILTFGTKIVAWRYTIFGPYERTPPPKGFQPHIWMSVTPQRHNDITSYGVGKEGIELIFQSGARAFLPSSDITVIGPAAWRTYVVEHDSLEIESPLIVSQEIGETILAVLSQKQT